MKFNLNKVLLVAALISFMACNDSKEKVHLNETTTTLAEEQGMNLANLLGTWINVDNTEEQFTLYNDGSVSEKNISDLSLKDWTLEENNIVFARKNSNNAQTQMNSVIYNIQELTAEKLVVKWDDTIMTYSKK